MRYSLGLLLSMLLPLLLCSEETGTGRHVAKMGLYLDGIPEMQLKDIRVGFTLWIEELAAEDNIEFVAEYYDSEEHLYEDFREQRFEYLALNPVHYLHHSGEIDPWAKGYWIVQKGNRVMERMLLLVKDDSGITSVAGLAGKKVGVHQGNYLAELFLDAEMLRSGVPGGSAAAGSVEQIAQDSTAVLRTFFGKLDACIVPEYAYELVAEMNPAVARKLTVLQASPPFFIHTLAVFHKNAADMTIASFQQNVDRMLTTARGQNILDLFKMKKMQRIEAADLEPLKAYYNDYLALKAHSDSVRKEP